mgnify:CR=1 FL=1
MIHHGFRHWLRQARYWLRSAGIEHVGAAMIEELRDYYDRDFEAQEAAFQLAEVA